MTRQLVLLSIASLLTAGIGLAGPLAPKKPSETVVISLSPFSGPCVVEQVATQITADSEEVPFALELGKVLMVTDITWVLEGGTAGDTVGLEFYPAGGDIAIMTVDGEVNARGMARGRDHFGTPVRVNDILCANPVLIEGTTVPQVHDLRVIGFLTNDR